MNHALNIPQYITHYGPNSNPTEKNIIPIESGSLKTVMILKTLILPLTHEVLVTLRTKVLNMKSI